MKKSCEKCKNYEGEREFNCTYYKIQIKDNKVAYKCNNFEKAIRVKKCCNCKYLRKTKTGIFMCSIVNEQKYFNDRVACKSYLRDRNKKQKTKRH